METAAPMLRQYRQLQARFPDALLLFRLGDFYEMFGDDARLVARQLNLVLTSRRFSQKERLPMCGIPYRQLTTYVSRLLALGHKIAIAEQMENARQAQRLIQRQIVRVITPGTIIEDDLLAAKTQNLLVALAPRRPAQEPHQVTTWGLAAVDLSTGEFVTAQIKGHEAWTRLLDELDVLQPSEILLPADLVASETWRASLDEVHPTRISPVEMAGFDPTGQRLLTHLGALSLEPYGCHHLPLATAAANAVLLYLQQQQLSDLAHLCDLRTHDPQASVGLDAITRRNLELTCTLRDGAVRGSLLGVLDCTVTAMGARMLRRWLQQPLCDRQRIDERLDAVAELDPAPQEQSAFLRSDLRALLDGLYDMERLVGRIGFGTANARDLDALRRTLERIPAIKRRLQTVHSARLHALGEELDELHDIAARLREALVDNPPILLHDGGLIRSGLNDELTRLRQVAAAGREWLAAYEGQERARTGIPTLRVRYNQVLGFFVELPRSKSKQVPPDYERRATVSHAERFVTPPLQTRQAEIVAAEERANELEYELFVDLRRQVAAHIDRLQRSAHVLAELDTLAALAETAARGGYTRPTVDDGTQIEIVEGRHPVVEQAMADGARFVPNDFSLDADGQRLLVITGPNMSGKSVAIRQVALTVLLAQAGSFVPARSARIGLVDRIFVRAGASDDIAQGRSTFLVEMSETAYILRHATARSLVILDEVGRGTSTYDGMALAWAVGQDLHDRIGARTLFATHFHELTALADELSGARNACLAVREQGQQVVFLYRLVEGGADRSYGVQVARLAGIPAHVTEHARQVMTRLEGAAAVGRASSPSNTDREAASEVLHQIAGELSALDVANTTPVQALVTLNEWQQRLRVMQGGPEARPTPTTQTR